MTLHLTGKTYAELGHRLNLSTPQENIIKNWGNTHEMNSEIMNWAGLVAKTKTGWSFSKWYLALVAKANEVLENNKERKTSPANVVMELQQAFDEMKSPN